MSRDSQSAAHQPSSGDVCLADNLSQAYAADPYFADGDKTTDFTFAAKFTVERRPHYGAQLSRHQTAHPASFHDHSMAGHHGVIRTLKAIKSCFHWPNADTQVRI